MPRSAVGFVFLSVAASACGPLKGLPSTEVYPKEPLPVVTALLATRSFDTTLPFDRKFYVRIGNLAEFDSVSALVSKYECDDWSMGMSKQRKCRKMTDAKATIVRSSLIKKESPTFPMDPVAPNEAVGIDFTIWKKQASAPVTVAGVALSPEPEIITEQETVVGWATTTFRDHFETDFGVAHGFGAQYTGLTVLMHGYLTPIRSNESVNQKSVSKARRVLKIVNVTAGFSVAKLASPREDVSNLYSFGSPIVAIGSRKFVAGWNWPRLYVGGIWYAQDDANPLVTKKKTKVDLVSGATFDTDVKAVLGAIYGLLGFK